MAAPKLITTGSLRTVYLGEPGAMVKLPTPNSGLTMPFSRAAVAHTSIDGGVSYTRSNDARRAYAIAWGAQTPDDADPILGFYLGVRGDGPFCLIDPAFRNQLGLDVSTMGVRYGSPDVTPGWSLPDSVINPPTSVTADPPPVAGSAVSTWSSPAAGDVLFEGTQATVSSARFFYPDVTTSATNGTAVPYLVDQPHCLSIYARARTGAATVSWSAFGAPDVGTSVPVDTVRGPIPLTTAWQRLWVVVFPSSFGFSYTTTPYVCSALTCLSPGSADAIEVCAAQHEIGVMQPSPWVAGVGVPRVQVGDPNNTGITVWDRRDQSLVLTEI